MYLIIHRWVIQGIVGFLISLAAIVSPLAKHPITLANIISADQSTSGQILSAIYQSLGHLILTAVAIFLAYLHLRGERKFRVEERERHEDHLKFEREKFNEQLKFEKDKFVTEEEDRQQLAKFREQEYKRFSQPASDIAEHLADKLAKDPHWAYRALEAAKLLPYKDTLFDERTHHFREEKQELATCFTSYLLKRCQHSIINNKRDIWLLIDAGTTLYPFFEIIGKETAKLSQKGEDWLGHLHLVTNNLPGIEQIIKTGRRLPYDRYSKLAIESCYLLPGIPIPIFAAVAGSLTVNAINNLPVGSAKNISDGEIPRESTFIALVVGNWIRIRRTQPRCPVPMARGVEHRDVKQAFINKADEVYVISPLGKIFVDASNQEVNDALGFGPQARDAEKTSYEEMIIPNEAKARTIKLITTMRAKNRLLQRHSNRVEDALITATNHSQLSEEQFAQYKIEELPHLMFPFHKLPNIESEEFVVEFPHYHTRTNKRVLEMFSVEEP